MTSMQITAQEPAIDTKIGWVETGEGSAWIAAAKASMRKGAEFGVNGLSVADAADAELDRATFVETLQKLGGHPKGPAASASFSPSFTGGSK